MNKNMENVKLESDISFRSYIESVSFHTKKEYTAPSLAGINIWNYINSKINDGKKSHRISKYLKLDIIGLINSMGELLGEIEANWESKDSKIELLMLMQEAAISVGERMEEALGENEITAFMEDLCEKIYNCSISETKKDESVSGIFNNIKIAVSTIEKINVKYEVLFLPYKYSMWDSMESVYEEAIKDEDWEVTLMPIPYFDRNNDGAVGAPHYEGEYFSKRLQITAFNEYDIESGRPDAIIFHNPYDEHNTVTMVHPDYFSTKLKPNTKLLVYVPYYMPVNNSVGEGTTRTPGPLYAHAVMVKSEEIKQTYINSHTKWLSELGHPELSKGIEQKFIVTGSPKADRLLKASNEDIEIPDEWKKKIFCGTPRKKVILFDVGLSLFMQTYWDSFLSKMERIIEVFEKKEDAVLLWRPHPLTESTLTSLNPNAYDTYLEIANKVKNASWGILDESEDMLNAILVSDAFYGSVSSIYELCKLVDRPVLLISLDA